VIDAYAHVGLPRFQSVADYQRVMEAAGIQHAVLCAFDSCPDIAGIHAAMCRWPDRFRGLGVPIGHGRDEIEAAARAQLAAGFSGLRLSDADVVERPWLLDILAAARGIAVVCGQVATTACAKVLIEHLNRQESTIVVGGHFAGVAHPSALDDKAVAALFAHPRFFIVFSRQGAVPAPAARAWAEAVLGRTGWARTMWGSEAPVLFWRNETMADALAWAEQLQPTEAQRLGFFGETARGLYFREAVTPAPLRLPFDPWDRARGFPATLWAHGLPVEQSVAGRLVAGWLAAGGHGTLGKYAGKLLDGALAPLPDENADR
jgi:predicted TIM-barrel fold metal-dependent hydrolase